MEHPRQYASTAPDRPAAIDADTGAIRTFRELDGRANRFAHALRAAGLRTGDHIAIVMDNYSPHLSTNKDSRVGDWAAANNVELAYVPTNASFLNRIECHFAPLRYFALDGTDHRDHNEQNSMIRRYIAWRNRHIDDEELRAISLRAKVA